MCPCVLIDKLRNAFGKKKGKSKETSQSSNSATSPVDVENRKEKSKKSKKSKRSERSKGKSKRKSKKARSNMKSPDIPSSDPNSLSSNESRPDLVVNGVELLGQVIHNKPDPKNFIMKVLQSERPDLVGPEAKLEPGEIQTLDTYLCKKGEMRDGINLQLGDNCPSNDSVKMGLGGDVTVVMLYARGRFASIYLIHRQPSPDSGNDDKFPSALALKTSRRMYAAAKIENEIKVLRYLYERERKDKTTRPTHITPMYFNGTSGGTPFLVMPVMDANLEKIRQEIGHKIPWVDAFYIGQEVLIAMRECHENSIIHRDIKPTNILLCIEHPKSWWICDFGDSCPIGETKILSPPDALTLPYISRYGHEAIQKPMKATIAMDIESWFYLFLDLFIVLPWKNKVEEAETLAAKDAFWASIDDFFEKNSLKLPPQILPIAQIVATATDQKSCSQLATILRDGFNKNNKTPPWKPSWIEKRPKKAPPPTAAKTPEKGAKSGISSSAGTTESVSKNQKTTGKKSETKSVTKSTTKSSVKSVSKG